MARAASRAPPKRKRCRDWPRINEKLVQRGDISFYLEFLDTWDADLARANKGKVGNPFTYPDALFAITTVLRFLFSTPYRTLEGLFRALGGLAGFHAPSYSTIYQRCRGIDLHDWLPQKPVEGPLVIAIDASGLKEVNHGEWLQKKWGNGTKKRRGWLKLHLCVNADTGEVLAHDLTTEHVGDQATFIPLVSECLDKGFEVSRALGDGIFDIKKIFNFLAKKKIAPGIRPRKTASRLSRGSAARAEEVRDLQDFGYERWRDSRQYAKRYTVERDYSAYKGRFGESTMALKWANQEQEVANKLALLNWDFTRPLLPS
jgi:hypothetical protein